MRWARLAFGSAREWLDADDEAPGRWAGAVAGELDDVDDDFDDLTTCDE